MATADRVVSWFAESVERERLGIHGVHVLVGVKQAQQRWFSDVRENVYSVSKGVCALAAGMAIKEGVL